MLDTLLLGKSLLKTALFVIARLASCRCLVCKRYRKKTPLNTVSILCGSEQRKDTVNYGMLFYVVFFDSLPLIKKPTHFHSSFFVQKNFYKNREHPAFFQRIS